MSKMYYDEQEALRLIDEYNKTKVIQNNTVICKDPVVEHEIMIMIKKIVIAIINNYRYYIFEDYEDLIQEGMRACYTGLQKYTVEKGTSFNYFSIISKRHLLNYTQRRQKHRNHQDIEEQLEVEGREIMNFNLFINDFKSNLFTIIDESFVRTKRKQYTRIAVVLVDYLEKSRKVINKTDLYAWCRSYGIKSHTVREFVKELGDKVFACWEM